jgi:hypothetical protein
VHGSFLFVLPDGRSAWVAGVSALLIRDRLWDLGVMPGAATAAVRISDAVLSRGWGGSKIGFTEREVAPLLEASKHDPPSWLQPDRVPVAMTSGDRERLLAKCDELLETLRDYEEAGKLGSLIADIKRLANSLRSSA